MHTLKTLATFIHGATNYVIIALISLCIHFLLGYEARFTKSEQQGNENKTAIEVINADLKSLHEEMTKHENDDKFFATINKH